MVNVVCICLDNIGLIWTSYVVIQCLDNVRPMFMANVVCICLDNVGLMWLSDVVYWHLDNIGSMLMSYIVSGYCTNVAIMFLSNVGFNVLTMSTWVYTFISMQYWFPTSSKHIGWHCTKIVATLNCSLGTPPLNVTILGNNEKKTSPQHKNSPNCSHYILHCICQTCVAKAKEGQIYACSLHRLSDIFLGRILALSAANTRKHKWAPMVF